MELAKITLIGLAWLAGIIAVIVLFFLFITAPKPLVMIEAPAADHADTHDLVGGPL